MTLGRGRWKAGCMILAVLTAATLGGAPTAVAQATSRSPVLVLGDAVDGVRFGTSQPMAVRELTTMFGDLRTAKLKSIGWCGLTAQSTAFAVLFNFERGKFVGYGLGNPSAKTAGQPDVVTAAGLRLGDTIAQAAKIYGRQFVTSSAQGGSWTVKTPTGELLGLLVGPPITGSADKVDVIGAGYFGCAAMGP